MNYWRFHKTNTSHSFTKRLKLKNYANRIFFSLNNKKKRPIYFKQIIQYISMLFHHDAYQPPSLCVQERERERIRGVEEKKW